ncbi:alpha-N-arabinofuranosidase [Actinocatenispora thailandica]|uniref:non-reducing end alpha-L-arabinofuranosidase n=1 Tax=Actinocatenispora thailandica TaxID=227318 RepID=A0A7R7DQZ5_9ACTN|nr:alpha-N-arabinofuranosidase [Actinocatenispora thailandica]BCJ36285.1 alpha-N-arabinofuranosidase [Actinocatenispora thailandica]
MGEAVVRLDPANVVGPLPRRLFGSFVEHLGRCVYTGIYEPDHPAADALGFRTDVAELVRELGPTTVRYPGGNFVSGYRWEDGVGPRERRPVRFDAAWQTVETNQVGTDDFVDWARGVGVEPMLAVNLGTRGVTEALDLLEYCNGRPGTALADQRAANGHREPHDVRIWCLGNEMDGPWQLGHKTAEEYARLAEETARAMRRLDGSLELVACGSSNRAMPTFGVWERTVLDRCFELVDHISAHAYYEPVDGDVDSFLASSEDMHRFIDGVVATADHLAAVRRSDKRITVSFDEWNVWFQQRSSDGGAIGGDDQVSVYDVTDAVVVGSLLITLLQHADRVAAACQAQLVNLLGPISTRPGGPAWRQSIFHPFALTSRYARGTVLRPLVRSDRIETTRYGPVDQLVATATLDSETAQIAVFAVNRSRTAELALTLDVAPPLPGQAAPAQYRLAEHVTVHDDDPGAHNTEQEPDRVVARPGSSSVRGRVLRAVLPPASWHCIRLAPVEPS